MRKLPRRSFLSLMAGVLAAGPDAVKAAIAAPGPVANPVLEGWALYRDHFIWTLRDDLVIQPGKATNEKLFVSPVPPNLALHTVSWAWREDTPLADCRKLLGNGPHPSPLYGMWLELMNNGRSQLSAPAHHFMGAFGIGIRSQPWARREADLPLKRPIAPNGEFSLQVETPALDLSAPVALQFYLGGAIAIEDWTRGGVPVPPA